MILYYSTTANKHFTTEDEAIKQELKARISEKQNRLDELEKEFDNCREDYLQQLQTLRIRYYKKLQDILYKYST